MGRIGDGVCKGTGVAEDLQHVNAAECPDPNRDGNGGGAAEAGLELWEAPPGLVPLSSPSRAPALRRGRPRGAERRGPPVQTLAAAMASVVEYKGLKAGYHCGYCDSEEGKASCGEWLGLRNWRSRLASNPRPALRAPRQRLAAEHTGPALPLPLPFPTRFFPARFLSPCVSLGLTLTEDGRSSPRRN